MGTKVTELTVEEFKRLLEETVEQKLLELFGDPDEELELRAEIQARSRHPLEAEHRRARGNPAQEVAATVTGKRFDYKEDISGDLIVYPTDKDGIELSGSKVHIPSHTIDFIRDEIRRAGEIAMGACRDNPSPGSLGEKLLHQHKSPQFLSYVIPVLTKKGFCSYFKEGKRYMIRYTGP